MTTKSTETFDGQGKKRKLRFGHEESKRTFIREEGEITNQIDRNQDWIEREGDHDFSLEKNKPIENEEFRSTELAAAIRLHHGNSCIPIISIDVFFFFLAFIPFFEKVNQTTLDGRMKKKRRNDNCNRVQIGNETAGYFHTARWNNNNNTEDGQCLHLTPPKEKERTKLESTEREIEALRERPLMSEDWR